MMTPPTASNRQEMNQQTRDPYRSKIVPTGSAETLAVIEAMVKNRLSLAVD
jgi:hypothetical protein